MRSLLGGKNIYLLQMICVLVMAGVSSVAYSHDLYNNRYEQDSILSNYIKLGDHYADIKSRDSALFFYHKANTQFTQIEPAQKRSVLLKISDVYRLKKELDSARLYLDESNQYLYIGDSMMNKAVYNYKLARIYKSEKNYKAGNSVMLRCVDYLNNIPSGYHRDSLLGLTYNSIGGNHYRLNHPGAALHFFNKSYNTLKSFKGDEWYRLLGHLCANIGAVTINMGMDEEARKSLKKATYYYSKLKDNNINLFKAYNNLGYVYQGLAAHDEARECYEKAAQFLEKKYGTNNARSISLYVNIGINLRNLREYEKALIYFKQALTTVYKYSPNNPNLPVIYNNLGAVYLNLRRFPEATNAFLKALEYNLKDKEVVLNLNLAELYLRRFDSSNDSVKLFLNRVDQYTKEHAIKKYSEAKSILNFTKLLIVAKDSKYPLENVITRLDKVIDFYMKAGESRNYQKLANAYIFKAYAYKSYSYLDKALENYQNAEECLNKYTAGEDNPGTLIKSTLLEASYNKAITLNDIYLSDTTKLDNLKEAFSTVNFCVGLVDEIRADFDMVRDDEVLKLIADNTGVYSKVVEFGYELYRKTGDPAYIDSSFRASEKGKSTVLLTALRSIKANEIGGIPDYLLKVERSLKDRRGTYRRKLYEEKNSPKSNVEKLITIENQLFAVEMELDSLMNVFETDYADYYDIRYNFSVQNIEGVKSNLNKDEVVIEYVKAKSNVYRFVIESDNAQFDCVSSDSLFFLEVDSLIQMHRNIKYSAHGHGDFKNFIETSNSVYSKLMGGLEDLAGKKLYIIPDAVLGYLPFETFVVSPEVPERIAYRDLPYLLKYNPVSYSYSATLMSIQVENKSTSSSLLSFAPDYGAVGSSDSYTVRNVRDKLARLDYAKQEVNNIHNLVDGDIYADSSATETEFKKIASDYDILHLAMHTVIDDNNPMFSKLIFNVSNDSIEDGFLNTYEVLNMRLNAKMAVLSACNTGSGKIKRGEGIMSLARSFIYAGVPDIVMTLWEVNDESGANIMQLFYQNLKKGMDKATALQQAKLTYLDTASQLKSHPFFWSAYVNIGDPSPIAISTHKRWLSYVSPFVLLLVLGGICCFKRKKRSK